MRVPSLGKKKNTGTTLSPLTCKRDFTFSSASLLSYTLLLLLSPSARLKSRSRIGLSDRLKTLPFNPPTALLFSPNLSLSFSLSLQSIRFSNLGKCSRSWESLADSQCRSYTEIRTMIRENDGSKKRKKDRGIYNWRKLGQAGEICKSWEDTRIGEKR